MNKSEEDETKILEESLDELRKFYDRISTIYNQTRLKSMALIAGEVTLVSFIFSDKTDRTVPDGADRKLFFFTAVVLLGLSFGLLLWVASTVQWKLPHDTRRIQTIKQDKNRNTYVSFLRYLHDDYCEVNDYCNKIVSNKGMKFNWTLFMLSAGVIILMVLKFAGGLK